MAKAIKMKIPEGFISPTDDDISKAKRWTLLRNNNAMVLSSLVEKRLQEAIKKLTDIAYKYKCIPEDFQFTQDKELGEEVAEVMEELEADIMELVESYSLNETKDKERKNNLLPWLAALHSKNTKNLSETLYERLKQFLYDTEAQIAAMKLAKYDKNKAISRTLATMHNAYTSPEMLSAFNKKSSAKYVRSRGIHYGNIGLSNSGANNVESFAEQTAIMAWMKSQLLDFEKNGAVAYYQLRGSNYPCGICDDEVGIHYGDISEAPYPHAHCMCYRVPLKPKDEEGYTTKKVYPNSARVRIIDETDTRKSDYKPLMSIARQFAQQGKDVTVLGQVHYKDKRYEKIFGPLKGTPYYRKCPDLLVDGKFYEYESYKRPWNKRKVKNMLSHGLAQSSRVVIDNNGGAADRMIKKAIDARRKLPNTRIEEVWLYEKGRLRLFFMNGRYK